MSPLRRWWGRRTVRSRLVLSTAVPLALALVLGTVALAAVFTAGRLHDVDAQTAREAAQLVALVDTAQVPAALPVPAGSTLLAQVLREDGTVLAATRSASASVPLVQVSKAGAYVDTDEEGSFAGVPLRLRVQRVGSSVVVVAAPLEDVRRGVRALRLVLAVVVPLLLLLTLAAVWFVAGLALRPVEDLRASADMLAAAPGARQLLAVPSVGDELARLASTLNALLTALHETAERQDRFVADAAHELRSPLASLRVQLEVAQAHPASVDATELVGELHAEVRRLGALVDDLLALARARAGELGDRTEVDLTALSGAAGPPVVVLGDPLALSRVVENLRSNAARHGRVVVTTAVEGEEAVLRVDDDGPGIAPPDRERVFERWVRLDSARTRPGGGAGLGLALVRELVHEHGGQVHALTSPLGGARLEVRLPLST